MDHRRRVGSRGEAYARAFLEGRGCRVLAQNFRAGRGEVDLVVEDGGTWVFVEVKCNLTDRYGIPEERVTERKQRQLVRVAQAFIQERSGGRERDYRFDVVAVELAPDLTLRDLRHIRDAFWATAEDS